ncbi:hypothetical protein N7517_004851 [Penicillium concentricum]|uniref:Uncharacterized protein n=1 Tax=Penicillium concentricum TaxID=293559 RepID=A0A9W9S6L9_9EURO|nr:uncharacterized protein N7517_004851 [Penicillium concentricum]KAJ5372845.1 hypothetical protein N7517_004851 [Penicillium concentricum]
MFASCHLKVGDVETHAMNFELRIAEHRSTESPDPPKWDPNGLYHSIKPRLWGRGYPPDYCT